MIVGTAGHIDHGKTTLVRALTGVDTDRLPEEKARGISIDLGYAYTPLSDGSVLGFVDVPGHERLVHTMVAGASGIDFALLVVAADDGVMPQTREHVAILEMLGVDHGAVALTKVDRVDAARVADANAEIAALLEPTPLRGAPVFAVDATAAASGGVARLKAYLQKAAALAHPHRSDGLFRLAVDRVFTLAGHGTVVTGTVYGGSVAVDDQLAVMPRGLPARVRSVHAQNRPTGRATAGERCALNLAGLDKAAVARGDWIADARAFVPTRHVDVALHGAGGAALHLDTWMPLHVHIGTADRVAHVVPLDAAQADDGTIRAQLVFDADLCATAGDRFIVRDARAQNTIGGGIVLDPYAPVLRRRSASRLAYLDAIATMLAGASDMSALLIQAEDGIPVRRLAQLAGTAAERLPLPADARVIDAGDDRVAFAVARWTALRGRVLAALERFHAQNVDVPGLDGARLRRLVAPALTDATWRGIVRELLRDGTIARSGTWLHLPAHRAILSDRERALAQQLEDDVAAGGVDPPWARELAARRGLGEDETRRLLRKCAAQGHLHQIVPDLFYAGNTITELTHTLRQLAGDSREITAAAFRDAIGIGRKRAVQILEFFDRVGYTRRVGDRHVLRKDSDWGGADNDIAPQ